MDPNSTTRPRCTGPLKPQLASMGSCLSTPAVANGPNFVADPKLAASAGSYSDSGDGGRGERRDARAGGGEKIGALPLGTPQQPPAPLPALLAAAPGTPRAGEAARLTHAGSSDGSRHPVEEIVQRVSVLRRAGPSLPCPAARADLLCPLLPTPCSALEACSALEPTRTHPLTMHHAHITITILNNQTRSSARCSRSLRS